MDEDERYAREALAALASEELAALEEMYVRGRTLEQAAELLGVPPAVVERRAADGLQCLRDELTRRL